jgi:nitrogen fixation protein NifU and related proteins
LANKRPRNFHKLEGANRAAAGDNPLGGDQFTVDVRLGGAVIRDISFVGSGCAISKASASLMSDSVKGKTVAEAERLCEKVHALLTAEHKAEANLDERGTLAVLAGVWESPAGVKCASLAWHTLHAALRGDGQVSTA